MSLSEGRQNPQQLSPAEVRLLQTLLDRFGYRKYGMSRMLFEDTYALLGQAARAYDASAFLASCAMSRAALEGALNTFVMMKRMEGSDTAWLFIQERNKRGEVHMPSLNELKARVIREGGLAETDRETMDRITRDGDLAVHLVQKHFFETVTYLPDPEAVKRLPQPKWWPVESDARENIAGVIDLLAALLSAMRIEPPSTSRNETTGVEQS